MIKQVIPLSMAVPDKEYIIDHIAGKPGDFNTYKGYGIFPGSTVKLIYSSPLKDPSAYEIMGSVLALRREDTKKIFIFSDEYQTSTC